LRTDRVERTIDAAQVVAVVITSLKVAATIGQRLGLEPS
jgi:hypothetical protein